MPCEPIGDDVDITPYRLTDPQPIGAALQAVATGRHAVTLYSLEAGSFRIGRLTAVNLPAGHLVFEADAQRPVDPGPLLLVTALQGIKLQCLLAPDWQAGAGQPWRVTASLPEELVRLQRREFGRLDAPLGRPYLAEFVLNDQAYTLNVHDLSLGGVGLRASPHEAPALHVGRRLPKVTLELGRDQRLVVGLEIRLCRAFRSHLLGEQLHIGCRFFDQAAAQQAELKRLLSQLERERLALMGGRRPPRR